MTHTSNTDSPVLTTKEVADLLRIKPGTVYELVRSKSIPFFFVGKQLRFDRAAVLAHFQQQGEVAQ